MAGAGGLATMLDIRRASAYDADNLVGCYLNQPAVKSSLGVPDHVDFESCSEEAGRALGADVMQSVKHLLADVLEAVPVLLYQGVIAAVPCSVLHCAPGG